MMENDLKIKQMALEYIHKLMGLSYFSNFSINFRALYEG